MTQQALLEQILSGTNRPLQVLAASGLVPLPPEELIPIQVALASSPDPEIREKAASSLASVEPRLACEYLSAQAGEDDLRYFATHSSHPRVVSIIVGRKDVPRDLLIEIAPSLEPQVQETLILRQDAIIEEPRILVALESNGALTPYVKRRIWEYREHLLPKEKVPPMKAEELLAEAERWTKEEVEEAIEEVKTEHPAEGQIESESGMTDIQIRSLPVPVRIKLARGASRQLRAILIRDTNPHVALTVLNGNNIPDQEVELIASSRSVCEEVLAEIPRRRDWIRKYSIAKALVKNPRTRLNIAIRQVPRLTMKDLRDLSRDRNVPDGVRTMARRIYHAKR